MTTEQSKNSNLRDELLNTYIQPQTIAKEKNAFQEYLTDPKNVSKYLITNEKVDQSFLENI